MTEQGALRGARRLAGRAAQLFPVRVVRKFIEHGGGTQAIVIAWNSLLAIFPIGLALAAIGGVVLNAAGVTQESIAIRLSALFPSDLQTQQAVQQGVDQLKHQTGLFALLALVGFLWTASGLFGAMEEAFGAVFGTTPRHFLRQKLMALAMMGLFVVLLLLGVGASTILPFLDGPTGGVTQAAVGVLSGFLLFFAIYFVVPNRRQRPSRVLFGALFAGIAFEVLTRLWPFYMRFNDGGLNRYGGQFTLLFVLLAFFYFLGLITILGADIIAVLDPPDPVRSAPPPEPQRSGHMGRVRKTALGAAALLIGVLAGRGRTPA